MGANILPESEAERELSSSPDVDVDFEGRSSSTTTTTSSDDSDGEDVFGARGLQRSVEVTSGPAGCIKRTYGVNLASYESTSDSKLDEQLEGLRALLPYSARRTSDSRNDPSIVMDAYRYIVALQQEVEELSTEVLEYEEDSSCDDEEWASKSHRSDISDLQPLVEVMRRDGVMEVRIVCANRPGLLVDVIEAVETRGLIITQARIVCHRDNFTIKYLSLENEKSVTISLSTEGGSEEEHGEEELDSVKAMLVDAICEGSLVG